MEIINNELELARNYALYTHRNIFLTGKAGTGKTTFLRRLREESKKRTIVVAPTGVAAINAGGMTIHSFFQLAPGLFLPGKMMAGRDAKHRFSFSKQKINILRSLDLLVIPSTKTRRLCFAAIILPWTRISAATRRVIISEKHTLQLSTVL